MYVKSNKNNFLTCSSMFLHPNYLFRMSFELFKCIRADLNLQQQVKNIRINCFSDLKMFQILNLQLSIFKSFPRSLDQFFLTQG